MFFSYYEPFCMNYSFRAPNSAFTWNINILRFRDPSYLVGQFERKRVN